MENITRAFSIGSHFIWIWIVVLPILVWFIGEIRYEWSLYLGDFPSEARAARKAWRIGTLYVGGVTGIVIVGWVICTMLLKT